MLKIFSLSVLAVACVLGTQIARSECTRSGDDAKSEATLELASAPGALRFVDGLMLDGHSAVPLDYDFSGTRIVSPAAASSVDPSSIKRRVRGVPVKWGTRLVSERPAPATVLALESGIIGGSMIAGSKRTLGGLVRAPISEHEWSAFLTASQPSETLAAYEYLYVLVLRADTGGDFRLTTFDRCSQPVNQAVYSQSDLLHEIARRRNALALQLSEKGMTFKPWVIVSLRPVTLPRPLQPDEAAALVEDPQGPVAHAQVIFSRAPHSGCSGTSDEGGIATCILQDNHGDDGDDESGPVVATFSGTFSSTRIAPPMATVVQEQPAARPHQAR